MKKRILAFLITLMMSGIAAADIIPSSRSIVWSGNVGIPGGIPDRTTICGTANAATYGDDSTDARSHIQGLIDACPVNQVVYIPTGIYRLSSELSITKGIVLRGDGPANTVLKYTSSSGYIINIGSGGVGTGVDITSGYTKDSTQLVLSSATGKDVGDLIWIDQLNDGDLVTNVGLGGTCSWCGRLSGTRSMAQISIITAKDGNTVTIDPPMQFTYSAGLSPQVAEISSPVTNAGIEDLKVYNTPGTAGVNIFWEASKYCWLKNVESERPHIGGSTACMHVVMRYSFRNEIRHSYFHGNTQTGSNSYGIQMVYGSSYVLIEDNIFDEAKAYIYAGWGSSAMVAGYNYIHGFQNDANYYSGDISGHGAHPKFFLLEGNYGQKFRFDNYWGSSSHNTGFRNYYRATQPAGSQALTSYRFPVDVDKDNPYFNLVGNVFGDPSVSWSFQMNGGSCSSSSRYIYMIGYGGEGCSGTHDTEIFSTMLRHGNYDQSTQTTRWCDDSGEPGCQGGDASHVIPASLYLDQKPSWWCNETPWPPIGPDLSPMVSDIPAKRRFEELSCTTSAPSEDTVPNPFSFVDVTDADVDTLYTSNSIVVTGIDNSTTISISGNNGEYKINAGSWTSNSGTVYLNDSVSVRQYSSSSSSTSVNTTLVIGTVGDTYTVTTSPPPPGDTTPPERYSSAPGSLPSGTTQYSLSVTTNENAICRFDTSSGTAYGVMPFSFSGTGTVHTAIVGASSAADSFGRSDETPLSTNWTTSGSGMNGMNLSSNVIVASVNSASNGSYYSGGSFASDQYSEITVTGAGIGPSIRIQSGQTGPTGYTLRGSLATDSLGVGYLLLFRHGYGVIDSISYTVQSGDILKIQASGSTISTYLNDVEQTALSVVDSTYSGGFPGVFAWINSVTGDDWSGGGLNSLEDGQTYNYYVRCLDQFNNANLDDYLISFTILADPDPPGNIQILGPGSSITGGFIN